MKKLFAMVVLLCLICVQAAAPCLASKELSEGSAASYVSVTTNGNSAFLLKKDGTIEVDTFFDGRKKSFHYDTLDYSALSSITDIVKVCPSTSACEDILTGVVLRKDGTVYSFAGKQIEGWNDIIDIGAIQLYSRARFPDVDYRDKSPKYYGITSGGDVLTTSNNEEEQIVIEQWHNVTSIATVTLMNGRNDPSGDYYVLGVKDDGSICVFCSDKNMMDELSSKVSGWKDVKQVIGNNDDIVGIKEDGTVVCTNNEMLFERRSVKQGAYMNSGLSIMVLDNNGTIYTTSDVDHAFRKNCRNLKNIVCFSIPCTQHDTDNPLPLYAIDNNGIYYRIDQYNSDGSIFSSEAVMPAPTPMLKSTNIPEPTNAPELGDKEQDNPPKDEYVPLKKGSKGEEVVKLQNRLNELGYSVGKADGSYGGKTEKAIKRFQKDNELKQTGIVDEETYSRLFSDETAGSSATSEENESFSELVEFDSVMMESISDQINKATDFTTTNNDRAVLAALLSLEFVNQQPDFEYDYKKPIYVCKQGDIASVAMGGEKDYVVIIYQAHPLSTSYGYLYNATPQTAKAALEMTNEKVWVVDLDTYNDKLEAVVEQLQ